MIAIESFKRFRQVDVYVLVLLALLYAVISFIGNMLLPTPFPYIASLFFYLGIMAFCLHLVRKAGSATLFSLLASVFTFTILDIGPTGVTKVYVFLIAGVLLEIAYLILKVEIRNMQIDVLLGTALAGASVPVSSALLLSFPILVGNVSRLLNLTALSFFIGIAAAIVGFVVWYEVRSKKAILRFEYESMK